MASVIRWSIVVGLVAHGLAHAAGLAVAWRLTSSPDLPYHTTLLNGRVNVGDTGMRVMGTLWLCAAVAFVIAAMLVARRLPSALMAVAAIALASLLLCALEWPYARIGLVIDALLLVSLPGLGVVLWRSETRDIGQLLKASQQNVTSMAAFDAASVPPPVARYLSRALPSVHRAVSSVTFEQEAEFLVGGVWRPLRATQQVRIRPAGFLWDARIRIMPLVSVYVRDAYVNGRGSMRADVLGFPMMRQAGLAALDSGALHRYLAEAVWYPAALLPSAGVRWQAVGESAAIATLTDGETTVSLEFRFDAEGDVYEVFTPARFAEDHGRYEPRPWLVRCSAYETHDGFRIPSRCEVEWQLPSGPQPYWRGRILNVRYQREDRDSG